MNRVKYALLLVSVVPSLLPAESLFLPVYPRTGEPIDALVAQVLRPEVFACLQVSVNAKIYLLQMGEFIASQLYEGIGVPLRWSCDNSPDKKEDGRTTIIIRLTDKAPHDVSKKALAYALPFAREGVRVTVFYDRFEAFTRNQPYFAGIVFGYILAHEIAHVLAQTDSHALTGLMRASWTIADLSSMRTRLLGFTPEDARFIRVALGSGRR